MNSRRDGQPPTDLKWLFYFTASAAGVRPSVSEKSLLEGAVKNCAEVGFIIPQRPRQYCDHLDDIGSGF